MKVASNPIWLVYVTVLLLGCSSLQSSKPPLNPENLTLTEINLKTDASFRALHWANDSVVWLSGSQGAIYRSINAGKSFEAISSPATLDFRSLWAVTGEEALIASAGQPAVIYRTGDGGASWQEVFWADSKEAFLDVLHFSSPTTGWAFSDPVAGQFYLLHTQDGGRTWQGRDLLPPPLSQEAGFAASNASLISSGDRLILATGGRNSRLITFSPRQKEFSTYTIEANYGSEAGGIYALAANDRQQVIAVGGAYDKPEQSVGNAYYSTDNGQSWKPAVNPPAGYQSGLAFIANTSAALSVGTSGSYLTTDGGQNWQPLNKFNLNTVRFAPNRPLGIAAGSKGKVYLIQIFN